MDHEGHRRESLRKKEHWSPICRNAIHRPAEKRRRLRTNQGCERPWAPVFGGYLVMRPSQCVNPIAEHTGERVDILRGHPALRHQAADQAKDIAYPMVQLGDQ